MKSFKKLFLITISFLFLFNAIVVPATASAQLFSGSKEQACQGITGGGTCDSVGSASKIDSTIATVINIFSWIVGVVAVIMLIIGGFRYITSGGDSSKVSGAKDTILYAIIGLVVVAMAQIIVRFVLNQF